jgi:hypothetical protein
MGLDPSHKNYNEQSHALFTSSEARADGVVYLDPSEPFYLHDNLLNIYANPAQPDFLKLGYGFTYRPYPAPEATAVWASAPETSQGPINLWVSHGPPKGQLDSVGLPPFNLYLKGCEAQRRKIATAKPLVCVFGHYHCSYGVEKVTWRDGEDVKVGNEVATSKMVKEGKVHDFTDLKPGKETVFINAAWMTGLGTYTKRRNKPIAFDLEYAPPSN